MASLLLLTGYMGSGKTTVGREVARQLGWEFIDLDEAVIAQAGRTIPQIFEVEGEAGFRSRELGALAKIVEREDSNNGLVVALGGGTLTNPASATLVEGRATVVYLDVEASEAWKRVCKSDRPLAQDREEFDRRLAQRRPRYEEVADLVIPVAEEGVGALAERVADFVKARSEVDR